MTDYSEEQRNELEALESIYPDSFTGDVRGPWPPPPVGGVFCGLPGRGDWAARGHAPALPAEPARRGPKTRRSGRLAAEEDGEVQETVRPAAGIVTSGGHTRATRVPPEPRGCQTSHC